MFGLRSFSSSIPMQRTQDKAHTQPLKPVLKPVYTPSEERSFFGSDYWASRTKEAVRDMPSLFSTDESIASSHFSHSYSRKKRQTRGGAGQQQGQVREIVDRINPHKSIPLSSQIIKPDPESTPVVPVGSKHKDCWIREDRNITYKGQPSYFFHMSNDQRIRVELSTAFPMETHISSMASQELEACKASKSLTPLNSNMLARGEVCTYKYAFYLPETLDADSKGIIGQWHGFADKTTVRSPSGDVSKHSFEGFQQDILNKTRFVQDRGYDVTTGQPNGYTVDQGGYPPLSIHIKNDHLYVIARADFNRVTDKTDRLGISHNHQGVKTSRGGTKVAEILHKQPLSDLPKGRWIRMEWNIVWPEWNVAPGSGRLKPEEARVNPGEVRKGRVVLDMNRGRALGGKERVLDWTGHLGNNDQYPPYFKFGIYKPGSTGLTVGFSGYTQKVRRKSQVVGADSRKETVNGKEKRVEFDRGFVSTRGRKIVNVRANSFLEQIGYRLQPISGLSARQSEIHKGVPLTGIDRIIVRTGNPPSLSGSPDDADTPVLVGLEFKYLASSGHKDRSIGNSAVTGDVETTEIKVNGDVITGIETWSRPGYGASGSEVLSAISFRFEHSST